MDIIDFKLPPCKVIFNSLTREGNWCQDEVLIDLPTGKSIDVGFYNGIFRVVVYQNQNWHDQLESIRTDDVDNVIRIVEDCAARWS